jgi:predicted dehydrogenase
MKGTGSFSRRELLKRSATVGAVLSIPTIIPASARGAGGRPAPSNRIVMGCIGVGGQGNSNLDAFLSDRRVQVVAVCDLDRNHLDTTRNKVNRRYGSEDCKPYKDFREVAARADIDVISMATPDHWHALVVIACAKAGKDIYGEKPFSHDLREGRRMIEALNQHGRIWQTGSWQRSTGDFRRACELVRNGYIGKVHTVEVGLPSGWSVQNPTADLDYDFWCGPAPMAPYVAQRTHWNWRWQMDYGGGQMMDWIGHHGDIAQWGLGTEYTGPVEIEPVNAEWPTGGELWDTPTAYNFVGTYANGVKIVVANDKQLAKGMGARWIGDKGWVWVDRGGFDTEPKSLRDVKIGPNEINLYKSTNHQSNFIDCVMSRRQTITPAEVAHRSASVGHLGQVAMILGRKINWDPEKEQIVGDDFANRLLGRANREPWQL